MTAFYHGGPRGLTAVEPRARTGAPASAEFGDWRRFLLPAYRVYVTSERRAAEFYAAAWAARAGERFGWVYTVRPGADLDMDLDEPAAWSCDSAEVTSVAGTVPASRFPELRAWHSRHLSRQPPRLRTEAELLAFFDRAVDRAVRHGHDRAAVLAVLDAAAGAPR